MSATPDKLPSDISAPGGVSFDVKNNSVVSIPNNKEDSSSEDDEVDDVHSYGGKKKRKPRKHKKGVLSDRNITYELNKGHIVIWPFKEENVNSSSYDITLGAFYYRC